MPAINDHNHNAMIDILLLARSSTADLIHRSLLGDSSSTSGTASQDPSLSTSGTTTQPQPMKCQLLDDKRHQENPRRPILVWFFDTSKQALAAGMVHVTNILVAYLSGGSSSGEQSRNPYFLNILFDTTLGVCLLYITLTSLHKLADYLKIKDLKSGHYGNPPRTSAYLRQLSLFLFSWILVKSTIILLLETIPSLSNFASWILSPLEKLGDPRLQVVVVMLGFPLTMNVLQVWLIDYVIKGKSDHTGEEDGFFDDDEDEDGLDEERVGDDDDEGGVIGKRKRSMVENVSSIGGGMMLNSLNQESRKSYISESMSPAKSHTSDDDMLNLDDGPNDKLGRGSSTLAGSVGTGSGAGNGIVKHVTRRRSALESLMERGVGTSGGYKALEDDGDLDDDFI
ncbi:hypothetical protein HDU76_002881 [Blyttiomyces sp. JEL0837]|nr:hypothetical protein HDU76_002881 [Blyttiomyces sp. JEL0837]